MSDDLIIKISGDNKEAVDSIKGVSDAAGKLKEDLKETAEAGKTVAAELGLEKLKEIASEGFGFLKEKVIGSLEAYREFETASRVLTQALQNQGIYTKDLKADYEEQAESVGKLAGVQADQLSQAQASIQAIIGQTPVTKELTQAIADLAAQQGVSLTQAANEMGRAISTGTGQLLRQGLQFAATDTEAQRLEKTLAFVQVRAGGMAEAANQGLGSIKGLEVAFREAEKEVGGKFAPAVTFVIKALTEFLTPIKEVESSTTSWKAGLLAFGVVFTGLITGLTLAGQAVIAFRAAVIALEISAAPLAAIPIAIAAIAAGAAYLVVNWETASEKLKVVFKGIADFVVGTFTGISHVIQGALLLDPAKIKDGLAEVQKVFSDSVKNMTSELPKHAKDALNKQGEVQKSAANALQLERERQDSLRVQLAKATEDEVLLTVEGASKDLLDLKKKEIETLTALEKARDKSLIKALEERLSQVRKLEENQVAQDKIRTKEYAEFEANSQKYLLASHIDFQSKLTEDEKKALTSRIKTDQDIKKEAYQAELSAEIDAHNKFLEEKNKYNVAYAALNQALHSDELKGFDQATNELAKMSNSKNETLKGIGKAASIAQITIKTAEAAMNVFAGFSAIPIVGAALGAAAAAAVVLYGAEQISNVTNETVGGGAPSMPSGDSASVPAGQLTTEQKSQKADLANELKKAQTQVETLTADKEKSGAKKGSKEADDYDAEIKNAQEQVKSLQIQQNKFDTSTYDQNKSYLTPHLDTEQGRKFEDAAKAAAQVSSTMFGKDYNTAYADYKNQHHSEYGFKTGGIVPGFGTGDKVPLLAEPGELIVPRNNFNEVVASVARSRETAASGHVSGTVGIKVGFNGPEASRVITVKQNEDKALGISRANA